MTKSISKNDIDTIANDMVSSLKFARLEAVKRIRTTTFSANQVTDKPAWTNGFTISQEIEVGDELRSEKLKVSDALRSNLILSSATNSNLISFDARGFANQYHVIEICPRSDKTLKGRRVFVEASGYVFSEVHNCQ